MNTLGHERLALGPVLGAFGEIAKHADFLADAIAGALTVEYLSCYEGRARR